MPAPELLVLLAVAAVLDLWALDRNGMANTYYSAAVQSMASSWHNFLYNSFDPSGLQTLDKPPAALWVQALSVRVFGFSSWAMLVPQALMGVGSVALLAASVRRWFGPVAGLVAGAILALTPVAVLMFRFDNPDAMLVLTMVAAAYTTTRAVDAAGSRAGTWWLVGTGALVGLGFLTK
jgi:4-amino-4-deoxy-L-arabinose transferase-like glycosyltransferase